MCECGSVGGWGGWGQLRFLIIGFEQSVASDVVRRCVCSVAMCVVRRFFV